MSTTLPTLLTALDLPLPELQSALLDGEVFKLDEAFCSVAEFDLPWRRAGALAAPLGRSFVAAGSTAAWVWGALASPPVVHDAFVAQDAGRRQPPFGIRLHEVLLDEGDVVDFGPVRVTAPFRTVVDLARGPSWQPEALGAARALARDHRVAREECDAVLRRRRNLPYLHRSLARLDEVFEACASPR